MCVAKLLYNTYALSSFTRTWATLGKKEQKLFEKEKDVNHVLVNTCDHMLLTRPNAQQHDFLVTFKCNNPNFYVAKDLKHFHKVKPQLLLSMA